MKLDIVFGSNTPKKRVDWWQQLDLFPKLIKYAGKKWEWYMYQETKDADYELLFSEIPPYDPNFSINDIPIFEEMFDSPQNVCSCGAAYTSFPAFHLFYCPKWTKW